MKDNSKLLNEGWIERKLFVVLVVTRFADPVMLDLHTMVVPSSSNDITHPADMLLVEGHRLS